MEGQVYLDNQATTAIDERVLERMMPYLRSKYGNAASRSHSYGWEAEKAAEHARKQVAALAGAAPREIVFTSGATEANNLAIKGVLEAYRSRGNHIVTVATEHKAVLDPVHHLERQGASATIVGTRHDGLVEVDRLRDAIRPETVLVTVMYANNEIGVIQPIRDIGAMCREKGVLFHTDAAQAFGKVPIRVDDDYIDLMSLTAHKIYGPKGIGALYARRKNPRVALVAQMDGGGHEFGMRSGTLNVPAVVGFGAACMLCGEEMESEAIRLARLRDLLKTTLMEALEGVSVNGSIEHRLPGNLNLSFRSVDAQSLLTSLRDVALSTGSACSSGTPEPSHVLRAIGLSEQQARSSVRFGLGRFNTAEEVGSVAGRVKEAVVVLRGLSPSEPGP